MGVEDCEEIREYEVGATMGKYAGKVYIPKGVKIANPKAKMTQRQSKFAHGIVGAVGKYVNVKNKY
jgi:hypothetical protein